MRRNIEIADKIITVVENGDFPVANQAEKVEKNFAQWLDHEWLDHVSPKLYENFSKIVWPKNLNYESIFLALQDNETALVKEETLYKKQAEMEKNPVWAKETEAVIKDISEEKSALAKLKKKLSLLIILRKKILKNKKKILDAFSDFDFTPEESSKVINALLEGDLRVTNLVKHEWKYLFWWFITFKWSHFLYGGKQFSKEEILQVAECSAGYDLCLMPSEIIQGDDKVKYKKIYIRKYNANVLEYAVRLNENTVCRSFISKDQLSELESLLKNEFDQSEVNKCKRLLPKILQITSKKDHTLDIGFKRTPKQERNKKLLGGTLAGGKMATSGVLCFVFAVGFLALFHPATYIVLTIAIFLALCNVGVCYLSRGKAMMDAAGFEPEKQKIKETYEENSKEKSPEYWQRKVFVGVVTMLACISAGVTAWTGLTVLLGFFGVAILLSNPFVITAFVGLCIIAAISYYSFQAAGIEKNFDKFKNLYVKFYGKGGVSGVAKIALLTIVSLVFLAVYATLTWFTVNKGVNKIFDLCGKKPDLLSLTISAISTTTTMFVNTFSQVCKVFDPQTYKEIREKCNDARYGCTNKALSRQERFMNTAKIIVKTVMLSGDTTTYCVAGGIAGGSSTGEAVGNAVDWAGAKLMFAILSPIILALVAITFSFPFIFGSKKEDKNKSATNVRTETSPEDPSSNKSWCFWKKSTTSVPAHTLNYALKA